MEAEEDEVLNTNNNNSTATDVHTLEPPLNTDEPQCEPESKQSPPPPPQSPSRLDELQITESPRPSSPPVVAAAGNLGDEDLVDGEESKEVEVEVEPQAVVTVEKGDEEDEESIEGEEESEEVVNSGGDSPPPPEPPVSGSNNEDDVITEVAKIETETEEETVVADFAEENKVADVAEDEEEVAEEREVADLAEKLDVVEEEREEADVAEEEEEEEEADVADGTVKEEETDVVEETRVGEERSVTIGTEEMAMLEEETGMDDVAEEMEKVEEETEEVADEAEETEMDGVAEEEEEMAEEMDDKVEETATEAVDVSEEMEEKTEEADMEETEMADVAEEMETAEETEAAEETEVEEVSRSGGGKRKRGKSSSKAPVRVPVRKKVEEDVCFICFDGGDLVLCDRRGCPKAYHPACVNRDEAFFRAKGRWNCGWHLCSNCEKNAYYMCYTCTFSLCKACIKDAVILCVRGNKGFCETCMKTVMLIEKNEQGNRETAQVDFDDKTSWEYLFKDYWIDLKGRLCLTSEELTQAKNPWKGSDSHGKQESPDELYDANDGGSGSDSSAGNAEVPVSKRRKAKKRLKSRAKEGDSPSTAAAIGGERTSTNESVEWASKELLEFVMHMKNGDKSILSQFDVQALLLEYIKRNKLRDPRRKSQIICDSRLQNLFGKQRVGHFEMLKLLESHFLTKDDSQGDDLQGSVVDTEANQSEADGNSDVLMKVGKDKRRKTRKKGDGKGLQSNLDDYAAIDMHNINLIYLRRTLVEDLLEDTETFHDKAVGSFVRIRISGSAQKQDLYRLVQVVGTNKVAEPYRVGKKMTDFLLEILNLNKTEVISIDIISNQEFTEDECKRLRQSIKCGLINRLTVGDIQEKAMAFQSVRVKDWLETEIVRLSHLRDRASDLGRRKELRECVEKLQLLKSPEERQRRLEEIPEIHADPNMDPSYESEEDEGETDDKKQENYMRPRGSGFSRRGREPISPRKGGFASNDSWGGTKNYSSMNRELSRNISNKGFLNKGDDAVGAIEIGHENLWNQGRDKEIQQSSSWEKPKFVSNSDTGVRETNSAVTSQSSSKVVSEISPAPPSTVVTHSAAPINETEKIWHYQDPARKVQGPFSIVQLRKWNNTGYFPADLRIWRTTEKQEDSLPLTDVLTGKFHKEPPLVDNIITKFQMAHSTLGSSGQTAGESWKSQPEISSVGRATPSSLEVPKYSTDRWGSDTNLPSPTPNQTPTSGTKGQAFENQWSPTPAQPGGSLLGANSLSGGNGGLQPPAIVVPESSKLTYSNVSHVVNPAPKTEMGMPLSSTNAPRIHSQSTVLGELHQVQVNTHLLPAAGAAAASMNLGADMKNVGAILQNLVLPSGSHNPPVESQAWGSGSVSKPDMIASSQLPAGGSQAWGSAPSQKLEQNNSISMPVQPAYGQWGNPSSVHNSTSALSAGNSTGVFPAPASSGLLPSDPWRPPVPVQPNIQPHAPPNVAWGMGVNDNQGAAPRQGPDNQNTGWGPMPGNPNMGWGGPVPANANPGWVAPGQGPVPGNTNPSWVSPGQPQAPGNANPGWAPPVQGQVPGNAVPNWAPPGQGPAPVNANPGWVPAGQGPLPGNANQGPGNANQGWGAPTGKPGMWGNEQNHSGDRFSGQRDRGSHSGDSGYGGGKPWNRQSSFGSGGGSSRPPFKGQRVCKFHESGHCKKGSSCDYMHT